MKLIERRTAGSFLVTLVGAALAFLAIFVIVDLVENIDKFIDQQAPLHAFLLYYYHYAPWIVVLTLPVAMLLASLATLGGMTRDNELLALKASGISPYRPIGTLAAVALGITGLAFLIGETVVPAANEARQMVYNRYVEKSGAISESVTINRTLDLGQGRLLFVRQYHADEQAALHVTLAESRNREVHRVVQAARMHYLGEGGRWRMEEVVERAWDNGRELYRHHLESEEYLPAVTPAELALRVRRPEEMGYWELAAYVDRGQARRIEVTRATVDLHMKVALPFANFIIVLFGASLAATQRRTGLAVGFTASVLICFFYYAVIRTGQAFGYNGNLPPAPAAWMGNILFGGLSLFFLRRARF